MSFEQNYAPVLQAIHEAADAALERNIEELRALCRIPSRRWQPDAMLEACEFLVNNLASHGATARSVPWPHSHPYVLGRMQGVPGSPVLLHYNHYDVEIEPAGNDDDLEHPPFAANIHDGKIYARGVADDKAPLMSRIHAARAFADAGVPLPVSVVFLHEGKEHLHSPGMSSFVRANREELWADAVLWENSWFTDDGRLLLKLSEKGLVYVRLSFRGLARDGSSQNSIILPQAARRLVAALASLQDVDGTVRLEGFYDDIEPVAESALSLIDDVGFDHARLSSMMGLAPEDFPTDAARRLRTIPTLSITSMRSGEPVTSVALRIPAEAEATLEFRLVPGQSSQTVLETFRRHLEQNGFADARIEVMGTTDPYATDRAERFVKLVADAGERAFGVRPAVEPLTPLVGNQGAMAGPPIVGIGVGRAWSASDPNQHIHISDYRAAVHHLIEIMWAMGNESAKFR